MGVETILLGVGAATGIFGAASTQDQARKAERERKQAKEAVKSREDQLAREAAAKVAADKKMETTGQRVGFGAGGRGSEAAGLGFMSMFRPAPARAAEDNIGRGSLFGN